MGYALGVLGSAPMILAGLNKPASTNFVLVIICLLLALGVAHVRRAAREMIVTWCGCTLLSMVAWSINNYR